MCEFYNNSNNFKNPKHIAAIVEQARIDIANILKISPSRLFFTPNITISNNMAINYIDQNIKSIITSEYEPACILQPLKFKAEQLKIPIKFVSYNSDSSIDWQNFKKLISENSPAFVALSQVHPKTGRFLPIKRISEHCQKSNSLFLCDVSLSIGKLQLNLEDCPIDFVTASSDKIGAMQGASFIFISNKIIPKPLYFGDSCEFGIVPGHQNYLAIYSLAKAVEYFCQKNIQLADYFLNLKNYLFKCLKDNKIEFESVNITEEHFLPNFVNLLLPQINHVPKLLINLEINDILVAEGPFSSQNKNILITFNPQNNQKEIEIFCKTLKELLI